MVARMNPVVSFACLALFGFRVGCVVLYLGGLGMAVDWRRGPSTSLQKGYEPTSTTLFCSFGVGWADFCCGLEYVACCLLYGVCMYVFECVGVHVCALTQVLVYVYMSVCMYVGILSLVC